MQFFTSEEVAKLLGCTESNVRYLRRDNKLKPANPHKKRNFLFSENELERFLSLRNNPTISPTPGTQTSEQDGEPISNTRNKNAEYREVIK
tara:strand:+ start:28208 stop:28480 length:273 start_codon:yes stop_codon:yes gene_type:complete